MYRMTDTYAGLRFRVKGPAQETEPKTVDFAAILRKIDGDSPFTRSRWTGKIDEESAWPVDHQVQ